MRLRPYLSSDCKSLAALFYQTVHNVNAKDYTKEQLDAWATGNVDLHEWDKSFLAHYTIVAVEAGKIVGFGDIDESGYLDRLYVHKDHQGKRIATAICDELERYTGKMKITTNASITAKSFFAHRGYQVVRRQEVVRNGIVLVNFVMEKERSELRSRQMYIRHIRPEDDRMSISEIYEQSWKHAYKDILPDSYLNAIPRGHWSSVIDSPGWNTLILFDQGKMVGTSSFCLSRFPQFEDCGEIISLYLLPEYMGKGYGKELLKAAADELSAQGFQEIFLWVLEENNRARHFYERCGFLKAADVIEEKIGGKNVREIRYVRKINSEEF